MAKDKCGIYSIRCMANEQEYVGSSVRIYTRWSQHRYRLRLGSHTGPYLQHAWTRHGEASFRFTILEECPPELLTQREQHYIDLLRPAFNSMTVVFPRKEPSPEMKAKAAASLRARAALITRCPKGHVYDAANTMRNQGKRVCRKCNAERVSGVYAAETPEQREARRIRANADHEKNRPARLVAMREYVLAHKAEKRAYDASRRAKTAARRREQRAAMTPEQREAKREQKRAWYAANRERVKV